MFGLNFISLYKLQAETYNIHYLKEREQNQLNCNQNEVFLKPNCLVQSSDYKQESYWKIENIEMSSWEPENQ